MKNRHIHNTQGFSLIETLFAIAILMIALVGPMTLAWSSLSAANDARNEVTATYLAQESLEYVRNVRDQAVVQSLQGQSSSWSDLVNSCSTGCDIDPTLQSSIVSIFQDEGQQLYQEERGNYLVYTAQPQPESGILSPFTRKTVIQPPDNLKEYVVTTTIFWKNHSIERKLELTEVLYDY